MYNEDWALANLAELLVRQGGIQSRQYLEFSRWRLQLRLLREKEASPEGPSPDDSYQIRRVLNGIERIAVDVLGTSLFELGRKNMPQPESKDAKSKDFVIVTALEEERDAILRKLQNYSRTPPSDEDIRTYYLCQVPTTYPDGTTALYEIACVNLLGMGRQHATNATTDAINRWRPRYVLLVGIAGGVGKMDIGLGDVLVADQIVDYELQKLTETGTQMRWEVHRSDARLLTAVRENTEKKWLDMIKEKRPTRGIPRRFIGPIASGDKVIASTAVLDALRADWPRIIGVEMEAAGVASAIAQSVHKPGFLMIKAVSDLADEKKDSNNTKNWRAYANDVAASYAIGFLQCGIITPS